MDQSPYSPDRAPADVEDIKSSVKKILTSLFRTLKTVLNNYRSARNIVKNWKEITSKSSTLLISSVLK